MVSIEFQVGCGGGWRGGGELFQKLGTKSKMRGSKKASHEKVASKVRL